MWIELQFPKKEQYRDAVTGETSESMCAGFNMLDAAIQSLSHCVGTAVPQVCQQTGQMPIQHICHFSEMRVAEGDCVLIPLSKKETTLLDGLAGYTRLIYELRFRFAQTLSRLYYAKIACLWSMPIAASLSTGPKSAAQSPSPSEFAAFPSIKNALGNFNAIFLLRRTKWFLSVAHEGVRSHKTLEFALRVGELRVARCSMRRVLP